MENMLNKNIIKILFTFTLSFIFCIFIQNVNATSDYSINSMQVDAVIMKNGDVHVTEKLVYSFNSEMNGVYRDIMYNYNFNGQKDNMEPTSLRYQAKQIENIKAYVSNNGFNDLNECILEDEASLSNGMDKYYSVTQITGNRSSNQVKLYSPAKNDSKKYIMYEYDIIGATVLYNDAGEFYWNFIGKDWDTSIGFVEVNISFEDASQNIENVKVYPHGYMKINDVVKENGKISFSARNVSSGKSIDARLVFDAASIKNASNIRNDNYNFEELEKIENKMTIDKQRYFIHNYGYIILVAVAVISFIIILIIFNKLSSRGKQKKPDYYIEPLDNMSMSSYNCMLGGMANNANLFMATILDLCNKKYLIMDAKKKLKKSAFNNIEYDYNISINKEANLEELNDYEIRLLNYLYNKENTSYRKIENFKDTTIELNERFKELGKKYSVSTTFYNECVKKYKIIKDNIFDKDYTKKATKGVAIFSVVMTVLLLVNIFIVSPLDFNNKLLEFIPSLFISIFYILFINTIAANKALKQEYIDEYNKLKGLERYLKEYSLIKDRYPIEITLWERYLVFASLFGIAKKVAKEFKEELVANGYDDNYIYMYYPMINISMHSDTINSSFASSSSGGYSGGGSGGGGRRWRRRRCLLTIYLVSYECKFLLIKNKNIYYSNNIIDI